MILPFKLFHSKSCGRKELIDRNFFNVISCPTKWLKSRRKIFQRLSSRCQRNSDFDVKSMAMRKLYIRLLLSNINHADRTLNTLRKWGGSVTPIYLKVLVIKNFTSFQSATFNSAKGKALYSLRVGSKLDQVDKK